MKVHTNEMTTEYLITGPIWTPPSDQTPACATTDPDLFHPETQAHARVAKAICARCPVQEPCMVNARAQNETFGIWGGEDERERGKHTRSSYRVRAATKITEAAAHLGMSRHRYERTHGCSIRVAEAFLNETTK